MIREWLGEGSLEAFQAEHFGREPLVRPSTAAGAVPLLKWSTVAALVDAAPDMFVVRNGRPWPGPDPDGFAAARALFAQGYTLVLRAGEEHDDGLCRLATTFERDLGGDVTVIAFCTPAGFQSFGWHYDCEDVFIAQTRGAKEYRLRRNTVNPAPTLDAMPRDMHFDRETAPMLACTLIAGDWLYIPRGWWHVGHALQDSLGISIGVLTDAARGTRPRRAPARQRRAGTAPRLTSAR